MAIKFEDVESNITEEPTSATEVLFDTDIDNQIVFERLQNRSKIQIGDLPIYFQPGLILTENTSFVDEEDRPVHLNDLETLGYAKDVFFTAIENFLKT